ncbi:MAG: hypothetical protein PUB17_00250 [Lachnospiraceae bacterium]|nr:hypothetical protein [Lachnospiraceae bacterium]
MELIGKWKIKKVFCITPDGMKLLAPEEIPQGEDYDEYRVMSRAVFDFRPDGMVYQLLTPEDFISRDTGEEIQLLDGMAILEQHPWKEENGEYYYHTGMEGETGDEPVDPYEKLEPDEDGCLPMLEGLILIEKI